MFHSFCDDLCPAFSVSLPRGMHAVHICRKSVCKPWYSYELGCRTRLGLISGFTTYQHPYNSSLLRWLFSPVWQKTQGLKRKNIRMNTSVTPGRNLPCVFCCHITFTPVFTIHILWNKLYFSKDLPENLNWLTKQISTFKCCSSFGISRKVLVKILSASRILYCNIPFFLFFFLCMALLKLPFLQTAKKL